MNTKTMRLPPRRVLTSNKRKECEGFDSLKPFQPTNPAPAPKLPPPAAAAPPPKPKRPPPPEPPSSNHLLAGYLAHEYLTRGTLFGQPWDPTRTQPADPNKRAKLTREAEPDQDGYRRYVEVSHLLKGECGAHFPGVVNPTQLARFLQM